MTRRIPFALRTGFVLASFAACCAIESAYATTAMAQTPVRLRIVDRATQRPLAARVHLRREDGSWHFFRTADTGGSAVRYEKQNWINAGSVEYHTCLSAHDAVCEVMPGNYVLTVERGKEFFPETLNLVVGGEPLDVAVEMRPWIDMAGRGWYSGETHLHRTIDELRTIVLAEDLNVAMPLTYWVTRAGGAPAQGDKNQSGDIPEVRIDVDPTHVIWPRNTEYEIFSVGSQRHTLGALFVLNHRSVLDIGVPPWRTVVERGAAEGALFDFDKLDWPFAMTLPAIAPGSLYELANNHQWRTEFAFRDWNVPAPPYLRPPFGGASGGEREWTHYTLGMYYTLLNHGIRLAPTAGTANGVHPVPAGFSRVYLPLAEGFSYEAWIKALRAGAGFVTTGPMLFAAAEGRPPGSELDVGGSAGDPSIEIEVVSEQPLAFVELVVNGIPSRTYAPQNERTEAGAYRSRYVDRVSMRESGWFAVRAWEDRPEGRFRFAHSAPWHVRIEGRPLRPRAEEREYLIERMTAEAERSRSVVGPDAVAEYERALATYRAAEPVDDRERRRAEGRPPDSDDDLRNWLTIMAGHRYTRREMGLATGLSDERIDAELERLAIDERAIAESMRGKRALLPYPGGRHPRTGFLDGALDPQRETKVSVFPPWTDGGYVVVDTPEAVFSNLGLIYLAHTHVPTVWSERGTRLPRLEWTRGDDGALRWRRELPNGIVLESEAALTGDGARMELALTNGTSERLTGLRVQTCVMLKAAVGFDAQTNTNKIFRPPFAAVRSDDGRRWIITAWTPHQRAWGNPPCPCLHSDPQFADCPPGGTVRVHGRLWFYSGDDIDDQLRRLAP
ncbi:MAG: hypothetical protein FJ297_18495 [Planctomycetes bacterium]|nr:hypothetical protein [Planctomycetota bacterium]